MELTLKSISMHLASWFVAGIGLGLGWWIGNSIKDVICKLKPGKKAPKVLTDEKKA
jgi:hypothetical protein